MADQRDTLQYMDAPLCCADDFFDRRATYQVKTVAESILAMEEWTECEYCANTVLVCLRG